MTINGPENNRRARLRRLAWIGALLLVLGLAGLVLYPHLKDLTVRVTRFMIDKEGARAHILAQPHARLYYVGLAALQVMISPIPGEVACFLGGMVFGWGRGFLLASLGITIGSLVNVTLGRGLERVFLERIIPARALDAFEVRARRYGLTSVFFLFLFPGAPKDTFCYLFGLTRIPIWSFLLVSSVARMPGTLVLSLQGSNVVSGDWTFFIVLTVASLVLLVPAMIYRKRIFSRLGLDVDDDRPSEVP